MDKVKFGEYVRSCRKAKGYTQQQLADMLSVNINSIGNIEHGKHYPDTENLFQLIEILDMSIDTLVFGESMLKPSSLPERLSQKIAELPKDARKFTYDTLEFIVNRLLPYDKK